MKKKEYVLYTGIPMLLLSILLGAVYRLRPLYWVFLLAGELALIPVWIRARKRGRLEAERFMEANMYIEQILYSFRKNPKVLTALQDVEKVLAKGTMKDCVGEAIVYIRQTYGEDFVTQKALSIIENAYPSQRIVYAHRLMLKAERLGGECENSIKILLKDRNIWEKTTHIYQKNCKEQKRNILIAGTLSCLLCLMTPVLSQGMLKEVSVLQHPVYQISTLLLLFGIMALYVYTENFFARNWLSGKDVKNQKNILLTYEKVINYNFEKERKKGILLGSLLAVIVGVLALFQMWKGVCIALPICVFMFFQHRVDYALAKRKVLHEIRKAFPDWLMEVSLLLQTENVANSIQKSIEFAPEILKSELNFLVQKLESAPESNIPYSEFLKDFFIPEVTSAMGMLYSLSDGGGSDVQVQMEEILARNAEWMGQAEELSNRDKLGKMYMLFLLPALFGALKMVVDMTLILLMFFTQIQI